MDSCHLSIFSVLDACGGRIDASNGTITSPSFPELYPANKVGETPYDGNCLHIQFLALEPFGTHQSLSIIFQQNCVWEILAPPQWRITVNFTHFDIEGNNQGRRVVGFIYKDRQKKIG